MASVESGTAAAAAAAALHTAATDWLYVSWLRLRASTSALPPPHLHPLTYELLRQPCLPAAAGAATAGAATAGAATAGADAITSGAVAGGAAGLGAAATSDAAAVGEWEEMVARLTAVPETVHSLLYAAIIDAYAALRCTSLAVLERAEVGWWLASWLAAPLSPFDAHHQPTLARLHPGVAARWHIQQPHGAGASTGARALVTSLHDRHDELEVRGRSRPSQRLRAYASPAAAHWPAPLRSRSGTVAAAIAAADMNADASISAM